MIIVALRHFWIAYHNNQPSNLYFICYRTYGMRLWSIFQMLAILAPSYNKSTPHIMVVAQWQR